MGAEASWDTAFQQCGTGRRWLAAGFSGFLKFEGCISGAQQRHVDKPRGRAALFHDLAGASDSNEQHLVPAGHRPFRSSPLPPGKGHWELHCSPIKQEGHTGTVGKAPIGGWTLHRTLPYRSHPGGQAPSGRLRQPLCISSCPHLPLLSVLVSVRDSWLHDNVSLLQRSAFVKHSKSASLWDFGLITPQM